MQPADRISRVLRERVANDRTRHAVRAAAAPSELGTDDRDDLDTGLAEQRVRVRVAVVRDHDAGLDRDDVVAAVPLLAFAVVQRATGLDDSQPTQTERGLNDLDERA